MVYGLYVLSPVTGLFCHRRLQVISRKLDTSVGASGPHDFAVRLSRLRRQRHQRPPHPAPRFVTIASAPLVEAGHEKRTTISDFRKEKFSGSGLKTPHQLDFANEIGF